MPLPLKKNAGAEQLGVVGAMLTHPGCVRELNEDFVAWVLSDGGGATSYFRMVALVADGMGGHAAGEVASEIAAHTVLRLCNEPTGSPPETLTACLTAANQAIIEHAAVDPSCTGMGTTCTVLAIKDNLAYVAHIGDSRAYVLRRGKLHRISEDHSLIAHLIKQGALTVEEAARSPHRGSILRALGTQQSIDPYIFREGLPLCAGDVFVLCSDGLTDLVEDDAIRAVLGRLPPHEACEKLVEAALAAGGFDNISVGVFALGNGPAPRTEARATRPLAGAGGER